MPKFTRAIPHYRKHRASGQAVVILSGQDFYLGPHGTKASKLEYDRQIAEWLARGRRAVDANATEAGITIVELVWACPSTDGCEMDYRTPKQVKAAQLACEHEGATNG